MALPLPSVETSDTVTVITELPTLSVVAYDATFYEDGSFWKAAVAMII